MSGEVPIRFLDTSILRSMLSNDNVRSQGCDADLLLLV